MKSYEAVARMSLGEVREAIVKYSDHWGGMFGECDELPGSLFNGRHRVNLRDKEADIELLFVEGALRISGNFRRFLALLDRASQRVDGIPIEKQISSETICLLIWYFAQRWEILSPHRRRNLIAVREELMLPPSVVEHGLRKFLSKACHGNDGRFASIWNRNVSVSVPEMCGLLGYDLPQEDEDRILAVMAYVSMFARSGGATRKLLEKYFRTACVISPEDMHRRFYERIAPPKVPFRVRGGWRQGLSILHSKPVRLRPLSSSEWEARGEFERMEEEWEVEDAVVAHAVLTEDPGQLEALP